MVKIRLMRMGAKQNPHYRVVVVDSRKKRSSDYIELLGHFDPRNTTPEPLKIDVERAQVWLSQGAQPTDRALRLLEQAGVEVPANVQAKQRHAYTKRVAAAEAQTAA
jgi:small subunit ribosomal protein S16